MGVNVLNIVNTVVIAFKNDLGPFFSLIDAVKYVEGKRGKPIIFIHKRISTADPGMCASLLDVDLVFLVPDLDKQGRDLYLYTILHELVHLYLGHPEQVEMNYDIFREREPLIPTIHKDAIQNDNDYREQIAELSATLLTDCIEGYEKLSTQPPPIVRHMFGYPS